MHLPRRNGGEPPKLINVRASMLVAIAVRGAIPNANIAGTVIRDVLPVTTLKPLVTKNTADKSRTCTPVILSLLTQIATVGRVDGRASPRAALALYSR